MKLIFTGDWHLRGNNPRNRIDDYPTTAVAKLQEVFKLAVEHDAKYILMPGDVWDRPEVSIAVLLGYAKVLNESPVPIYITPGNHDIYGYNLNSYGRSSLRLLEMLVPKVHVITEPKACELATGRYTVYLTATPYSRQMDINGYGYSPEVDILPNTVNIHMAHGMLLDHKPPFDRYSDLYKVPSTADIVLTGHDHLGYGVYNRADGVTFCNPGSLLRISASVSEIERQVRVALIDVDTITAKHTIEFLPLTTARPGDEVLDRSRIEEEKQRQYAMEAFSTLIQTHTGGKVLMDINQIVDTIAAENNFAPDVVKTALEVIDQQRETVV
jgi:exonuclease SbcD